MPLSAELRKPLTKAMIEQKVISLITNTFTVNNHYAKEILIAMMPTLIIHFQ
jgi:hypothetical protein